MKQQITALLVLWCMAGCSLAHTSPFEAGLNPSAGLQYLQRISSQEIYPVFCQDYYEDAETHDENRKAACINAIELFKAHLVNAQSDESAALITYDLIVKMNYLLRGFSHRQAEVALTLDKQPNALQRIIEKFSLFWYGVYYGYGLELLSLDVANETLDLSSEIYKYSSHPLMSTGCYFGETIEDVTEQICYYEETGPKDLRLRSQEELASMAKVQIKPTPIMERRELIEGYLAEAHSVMLNSTWESERDFNGYLASRSRVLLLAHVFEDGNTRTARLIINMFRLLFGLEPIVTANIPNIRSNHSNSIVNTMYEVEN